ncbi:MAG TPA: D-alanyl-D-alanine carboxypeptidase/D-alanyl-D-alanine-endopeptidase [Bryobacteraceae bacterium]|nr:D-alanyl-D-alanine carboxypeptidase/D-alanyl-D-alanine-endopeptidase [Bryobacteraceae bacterium]
MKTTALAAGLACWLACPLPAAGLAEKIDRAIESSPAARLAYWGIQVVDLDTGKTLYQRNPERYFVPASNTKLFTAAMALTRLGPDYTFVTRIVSTAAPDAEGRITGDLCLVGGGDPNLSARAIPYQKGPVTGDPLAAIAELADQVAARGVKRIAGSIVGDDTWYVWEPYATGWAIEDPISDDGAPVSALTINDNTLVLSVHPGARAGDLAWLTLNPSLEYYRIGNRVRTGPPGSERHVTFDRLPDSLDGQLWGTLPVGNQGQDLRLGIQDPARYAAMALRAALEERGITVEGDAVARHLFPDELPAGLHSAPAAAGGGEGQADGFELARRVSAPLLEDLRITAKVSQNLHAEMALRAVGKARRNVGSFEAGLDELKSFLAEAGIGADSYSFHDGSGLARLNVVSPAAVVKLLRFMYASPQRENWISLLPVGGQDGTLANRFGSGAAAAGKIHAKTGSLSHVSALSGYIERPHGRWLAFSILVNNYNSRTAEVRGVMDQICNFMVE